MNSTRRTFVAFTAASYSRILGANDRIRAAGLGTGGRCRYLLGLAKEHGTEIMAACDVYEPNRAQVKERLAPEAREYLDYREVLERKDFDVAIVGSPDHWHVPMTMDAVRAGKDVYVEKPISHSIEEGEALLKLMATSSQIVQVGYQQRSWPHFIQGREVVASGKLGQISLVQASWYQAYARRLRGAPPTAEPAKLDWKRFLGAAPDQPYDVWRFRNWRWFWDFGGGHLTDLYSHYCDVIHWYLGVDTPQRAIATGSRAMIPQFECPDTISASYDYPKGRVVVYQGSLAGSLDGGTIWFRGMEAVMKVTRDGYIVYPEGVVPAEKTHYPAPLEEVRSERDGTFFHMGNFLECVRSRKRPNSPPETAVPAARAAHLGNQAYRSGRPVNWNG